MKIALERTIRPADYESFRFQIEISTDDLPPLVGEDGIAWSRRATFQAYKEVLNFEVFNKVKTPEVAKAKAKQFADLYGLKREENDKSK